MLNSVVSNCNAVSARPFSPFGTASPSDARLAGRSERKFTFRRSTSASTSSLFMNDAVSTSGRLLFEGGGDSEVILSRQLTWGSVSNEHSRTGSDITLVGFMIAMERFFTVLRQYLLSADNKASLQLCVLLCKLGEVVEVFQTLT